MRFRQFFLRSKVSVSLFLVQNRGRNGERDPMRNRIASAFDLAVPIRKFSGNFPEIGNKSVAAKISSKQADVNRTQALERVIAKKMANRPRVVVNSAKSMDVNII